MSLKVKICFCVDIVFIFYEIYFYGVLAYFIYIYYNLPTE